ncbi:MAG: hypothetical protein ACJAZ2_001623 [Glaciecola sp.]
MKINNPYNIFLYSVILLFNWSLGYAQSPNNWRLKIITVNQDTIKLDSLSIIPGSVVVNGLDSGTYQILYPKSTLIVHDVDSQVISLNYRVFPMDLSKDYKHRNINVNQDGITYDPFTIKRKPQSTANIFSDQTLQKSGSISRGLNFGNTRDLSVSSNMNLQLAGKIQDIEIAAAITDNNIPIQPEGNTQQLQDFDQVYVQFSKNNNTLIAGDYKFEEKTDEFLRFNKKAQGLHYEGKYNLDKAKSRKMDLSVGLAVSRGKFGRNQITGTEGNQGPYQLKGAENESFIIVLSGTEKVYIDGKLMARGMNNDYIIDYNTGEITFTNNQLVTKDKRIIVEFQYSDRNFGRTLYSVQDDITLDEKTKFSFKFYSEQDMKFQQLLQTLSAEDISLLDQVGDSIHHAISPRVDSMAYTNNLVLYEKIDSTVEGDQYEMFKYSTDPLKAFYQLSFSNVGHNNGNYIQEVSGVNGRVFSWVAPLNGVPQGSYDPVVTIISPKQKQMATLAVKHQFKNKSKLFIEGAISNDNKNLFSDKDKRDDQGVAVKTKYDFEIPLSADALGWKITGAQTYSLVSKTFKSIERFRSVEFERDWNTEVNNIGNDEHWVSLLLQLKKEEKTKTKINSSYIDRSSSYKAFKNDLGINFDLWKGASIKGDGSVLNSRGKINSSEFFKHKVNLTQKLGLVAVHLWQHQENKLTKLTDSDSLIISTTNDNFNLIGTKLSSNTTSNAQFSAEYVHRYDYIPSINKMKLATTADDYGLTFQHNNEKKTSSLKLKSTLRQLHIQDTILSNKIAENTLLNRIEYNFKLFKGMISSKTFFELGTGNELKREFTYIEVNPGQGIYIWIDHNGDDIQQLNEFEITDDPTSPPNFLRVFLPSTEFVKTYTNQLTQSLYLSPSKYFKRKSTFTKFLTRFSDQAYGRLNQKNTKSDGNLITIPFSGSINDSSLISITSSFRNTIYFNRSNPVFGLNYSVRDNRNKNLLLHGYDARKLFLHSINIRYNIFKVITLQINTEQQEKLRSSEIFPDDNYEVASQIIEPKIHFQKNSKFRFTVLGAYKDKRNSKELGGETSIYQKIGWTINYAIPGKGRLNVGFDYINTSYNGENTGSSPLRFEMLEGLQVGTNFTWNVRFQQSFKNNLQANITYDGRSSPGFKVVHTGGLQVQLLF